MKKFCLFRESPFLTKAGIRKGLPAFAKAKGDSLPPHSAKPIWIPAFAGKGEWVAQKRRGRQSLGVGRQSPDAGRRARRRNYDEDFSVGLLEAASLAARIALSIASVSGCRFSPLSCFQPAKNSAALRVAKCVFWCFLSFLRLNARAQARDYDALPRNRD